MIAVAAVRYFMVRFSRGKVIAFDIDEALSFEGESGPYLQYSAVRAQNTPVGYVLTSACGRHRAGVATDMGHEGLMPRELAGCSLLVLEFNHDVELLRRNTRYPRNLKERILGDGGHLSNEQAARLLQKMFHLGHGQRLASLVLAHLSEENNTPALALAAAREVLERFRIHERVEVKVAGPDEPVTVSVRQR